MKRTERGDGARRSGDQEVNLLAPDEVLAVSTSLKVAAEAVAWSLPLALGCAVWISRRPSGLRALAEAALQAPLVLSPVVVGLLLLMLFGAHGPVGGPLRRLFGVTLVFTQAGAALAAGVGAFPLMLRSAGLALAAVDPKLELAAASLGAGPWDRLWSVTLPLAAPGILSAAVFGFAACLGEFGAIITFAGDIPGLTETLPLAIWGRLQAPGGEGGALRLALVSFVLSGLAVGLAEAIGRSGVLGRGDGRR